MGKLYLYLTKLHLIATTLAPIFLFPAYKSCHRYCLKFVNDYFIQYFKKSVSKVILPYLVQYSVSCTRTQIGWLVTTSNFIVIKEPQITRKQTIKSIATIIIFPFRRRVGKRDWRNLCSCIAAKIPDVYNRTDRLSATTYIQWVWFFASLWIRLDPIFCPKNWRIHLYLRTAAL